MAGLMFAHGDTATRLRPATIHDPYSDTDELAVWGDDDNPPTSLSIPGVAFDPGGSREPLTDGRTAVITEPTIYDPSFADVLPGDRIVVRGKTYDVIGDPGQWRSPFTGWAPGQVINLKRVEG